jgi:hypothetical protein
MPTIFKLLIFTLLLALFTACGPEPVTEEIVQDEPVNEVEAEVKAMEEAPLNIPSVEDEVVEEKAAPIEVAEPEPEPEPLIPEPEIIEDVESETVVETVEANTTEPEPASPVELLSEDTNTTEPEPETVVEDANVSVPEEEPVVQVPPFKPYTEQIGVLKIGIEAHAIRLMMKDPIIKYFSLTSPDRIVIDFKDIRYLEPMMKEINSPLVTHIATATHDNYNRVVIYLKEAKAFTISKNRGDWLIDLK